MGFLVGVDPDDLTGHQRVTAALQKNREFLRQIVGLLGDTGARLGGAPRLRATWRVLVWGAVAMAVTAAISIRVFWSI